MNNPTPAADRRAGQEREHDPTNEAPPTTPPLARPARDRPGSRAGGLGPDVSARTGRATIHMSQIDARNYRDWSVWTQSEGWMKMGADTSIAWTDHTYNPIWGCTRVSDGCRHCYAAALARRMGYQVWGPSATRRVFGDKHWAEPVTWDRSAQRTHTRRRVFVGSMCDWCDPHPAMTAARPRLWALIRQCSHLDWLLLTKRAERIEGCLPADWGEGYANVWLGTSVENNDYAWRAETLALIPAAVRFVSCEPALGPLDRLRLDGIDWVIYGGESGPGYRAHDPQWARDLLARCRQHPDRPAFFFKQSAGRRPGSGVMLDGQIIHEYPVPRTP